MKSIHAWIENQERSLGALQCELYLLEEKDGKSELLVFATRTEMNVLSLEPSSF